MTGTRAHPSDLAGRARRALGRDLARLARPRLALFWLDLSLCVGLGGLCFAVALRAAPFGPLHLIASALAVLSWLRALIFVHEISHRRRLPGFEAVWNLLVGLPLCVPSSLYVGTHLQHHATDRFATRGDPEYAPIAQWSTWRRVLFVGLGALVPLGLVLRWGVLAPLSLMARRRLRPFVVARCSTLAINPQYARDVAAYQRRRDWLVLEGACAVLVWTVAGAIFAGWLPGRLALQWAAVLGGVFTLNQLRTLAAHGYTNFGCQLDRDAQYRDSIDLPTSPVTLLIAPLGLRRHALHHLLPEIPYHNLGATQRALASRLAPSRLDAYGTRSKLPLSSV